MTIKNQNGNHSGAAQPYATTFTSPSGMPTNHHPYFSQPFFTISTVLDVDTRMRHNEEKITELTKFRNEQELINNLHESTKEILRITNELITSGKFEDVVKLDKYIREKLFNNKFDNLINEPENK